ncbi:transcriptional regulator [Amycolatopsis balhimycina DSM 5908]|uniref:Transcriptional regulator n=1 Tax=Amycolatopsis balhimycina DSM 5908 TaxID=1081091 RepID=A0A428X651_AMYBA|nr:helix-turn-helix domain-containing protein [Amycolatopsis balhimycina]RSM50779.1 transcriptional regulator [Amycolatopsis balhimycina DSM 5908]
MTSGDARKLPAEALEVLRRRAVAAVEAGASRVEVARMFGVSRKTVGAWVQAYRTAGDPALRPKPRGRRPGEQLVLSPPHQAATIKAIIAGSPETHGLPHRLWNRQAVAEFVNHRYRILLSATTVTHYLGRWGLIEEAALTPDPARRPIPVFVPVQRPAAGAGTWLPDGEPLWLAWTRPHTPPDTGRGPVAAGHNLLTGFRTHFGDVHVLVAVTNRGVLHFQARLGPFDAGDVTAFLRELAAQAGRGLNVVVGRWPAGAHEVLRSVPAGFPARFILPPG